MTERLRIRMPAGRGHLKTAPGPIALFLLLWVAASCGPGTDYPHRTDGAATWWVRPEPLLTIGELEGDPETLFSRIAGAALLPDGSVAVGDNGSATLRIFSPEGTFICQMGGRGEGPGEMAHIFHVSLRPPDTLLVHDPRLLRLTRFLTSGELVSTLPLQTEDGYPELYLGKFSNGDLAFAWIRQGPRDPNLVTPDEMRIGRFSPEGAMVELLGTATGMRRLRSPIPFSPHFHGFVMRDSIFLTDGFLPEIQVWDGEGNPARVIRVPIAGVDPGEAIAALETELEARESPMARQLFETHPLEEGIPHLAVMRRDDQNRLWVKKYDPRTDSHLWADRGRGGEWLVLEPGGEVVASVRLPKGFLLLDVRGNRVAGKTVDDLGVERIQVHEIMENGV